MGDGGAERQGEEGREVGSVRGMIGAFAAPDVIHWVSGDRRKRDGEEKKESLELVGSVREP